MLLMGEQQSWWWLVKEERNRKKELSLGSCRVTERRGLELGGKAKAEGEACWFRGGGILESEAWRKEEGGVGNFSEEAPGGWSGGFEGQLREKRENQRMRLREKQVEGKPELGRESCYGELRELFRDCREKVTREKTIWAREVVRSRIGWAWKEKLAEMRKKVLGKWLNLVPRDVPGMFIESYMFSPVECCSVGCFLGPLCTSAAVISHMLANPHE